MLGGLSCQGANPGCIVWLTVCRTTVNQRNSVSVPQSSKFWNGAHFLTEQMWRSNGHRELVEVAGPWRTLNDARAVTLVTPLQSAARGPPVWSTAFPHRAEGKDAARTRHAGRGWMPTLGSLPTGPESQKHRDPSRSPRPRVPAARRGHRAVRPARTG